MKKNDVSRHREFGNVLASNMCHPSILTSTYNIYRHIRIHKIELFWLNEMIIKFEKFRFGSTTRDKEWIWNDMFRIFFLFVWCYVVFVVASMMCIFCCFLRSSCSLLCRNRQAKPISNRQQHGEKMRKRLSNLCGMESILKQTTKIKIENKSLFSVTSWDFLEIITTMTEITRQYAIW